MHTEPTTIVQVISEHKRRRYPRAPGPGVLEYIPPAPGFKRVMAIVRFGTSKTLFTRHCDTRDGKTAFAKW